MARLPTNYCGLLVLVFIVGATNAQFKCGSQGNVYCNGGDTCCYDEIAVISPFCIEGGSTDQCCRWGYPHSRYQTATRCRADQECCDTPSPNDGDFHTGYCCNPGSSCCKPAYSPSTFGSSACCPADGKCCRGSSRAFCCAASEECDLSNQVCIPPSTVAQPTVAPTPSPTESFNCPYAGSNNGGINCNADTEVCCGAGSMSPQCLPKDSDRKCCTHYIAATTCSASQGCCGAYGVGASSYAFCCDAGSTCCHAQSMSQGATCCPGGSTCCAGTTVGLCCALDEECVPTQNTCKKRDIGSAPTSNAPTVPNPSAGPTSMPAAPTPGAQTTQAGQPSPTVAVPSEQPADPLTTSVVNGNVGGNGDGASAFSPSSSRCFTAIASVAWVCWLAAA